LDADREITFILGLFASVITAASGRT